MKIFTCTQKWNCNNLKELTKTEVFVLTGAAVQGTTPCLAQQCQTSLCGAVAELCSGCAEGPWAGWTYSVSPGSVLGPAKAAL